jgi:hypothetical protein
VLVPHYSFDTAVLLVEMDALGAKLKAYVEDPTGSLDLSGLDFGIEGVEKVASFLPKR